MREWFKTNRQLIIKTVIALVFPTVATLFYCLLRGVSLQELYIPASYNNDCVFYYKMVESIVKFGGPIGYFGFNESHALIGGFAAWNPALLFIWSIWGVLFGWSYTSVIVCNLVLFSAVLAIFTVLSEPNYKEFGMLLLLLFLFPSFYIHLLNVLPEIVLGSLVLLYFGFAIRSARKTPKLSYVVAMFIIAGYLTIVRPYMVLFVILPTYYLGKLKKKRVVMIVAFLVVLISVTANILTGHYFTSPYFEALYNANYLKAFAQGHFSEGFWETWYVVKKMCLGMWDAFKGAFDYGLTMGTQYVLAIVAAFFAFPLSLGKSEKKMKPIYLFFSLTTVTVLLAIVFLLQKVNEGGRHIWALAIAGLVICAFSEFDRFGVVMKSVTAGLMIVFLARGAMVPTDYDIPIREERTVENVEYWQKVFDEKITVDGLSGYDATIIWVVLDYSDGNSVITEYSELYALPEGMGISCCLSEYVCENIDALRSRYMITDSRGEVAKLCGEKGLEVIGEHDNLVMYRLH